MNRVIWLNRGAFPVYFGFCPSKAAWAREMRKMGVPEPYPTSDARVTTLDNSTGKVCCIVTLAERIDVQCKRDPIGFWALVAHEAVHIWQKIRAQIGEREPSAEFEAYTVQHIFSQLCEAYENTRGANAKRRILRQRRSGRRVPRGEGKHRLDKPAKQPARRKAGGSAKGKRVARRKVPKRI